MVLDRLARSQLHLLQIMEEIESKGAKLVSVMDNIDTGTATGKMVVGVLAVLAEFERNLLMERCAAGVKIARQRNVPVHVKLVKSDFTSLTNQRALFHVRQRTMLGAFRESEKRGSSIDARFSAGVALRRSSSGEGAGVIGRILPPVAGQLFRDQLFRDQRPLGRFFLA